MSVFYPFIFTHLDSFCCADISTIVLLLRSQVLLFSLLGDWDGR